MLGPATPARSAELSRASGVEAERIFLTLMIAHHKGGRYRWLKGLSTGQRIPRYSLWWGRSWKVRRPNWNR
ncbi:MAG: DUF305 domain-containing protein [Mycetocola sp.]